MDCIRPPELRFELDQGLSKRKWGAWRLDVADESANLAAGPGSAQVLAKGG